MPPAPAASDAAWWPRRIEELEGLVARLEAERQEQRLATRSLAETARRDDGRVAAFTDESLADEEAAAEATRRLSEVQEATQEAQAAWKELDVQKALLVREIQEATLDLGIEANAAFDSTSALGQAESRAEGSAAESWALRRHLRELGDRHAELAQEAAAQRTRRVHVRENVREAMAKQEAERAELHTELRAHTSTLSGLEGRVAAARNRELDVRSEAKEVRVQIQDQEALVGSGDADCEEFHLRIREMRAVGVHLRHELQQVQGQLRHNEFRAWEGTRTGGG